MVNDARTVKCLSCGSYKKELVDHTFDRIRGCTGNIYRCESCGARMLHDLTSDIVSVWGDKKPKDDNVAHPAHYTSHPSGIECIQITEHMGFNLGNALKYIWRCDLKRDAIEDLEKAKWYVEREIDKRRITLTKK